MNDSSEPCDAGLTPADLSRELDVPQKRIRDYLRATYGLLDGETTRWRLTEDQAAGVRDRFGAGAESSEEQPLHGASVPDLLGQYAEILAELRARGIVRTSNAPLGDYAEYLTQQVYGGELAANSVRSYDLIDAEGRRVQVKARTLAPTTSPSSVFSVFRSFDFDVAVLLVFSQKTYELHWAVEMEPATIEQAARWSSHVNGRLLRVALARRHGIDVTVRFDRMLGVEEAG
ncbi:hypothetical protein ACFWN7_07855 [Agromyces sp. NPDC058484]|uniref:hypothetical protein n=1 Tax=Agromyces sp. NPDC058484 TaxID=3346524 RepID=UPI003669DABC